MHPQSLIGREDERTVLILSTLSLLLSENEKERRPAAVLTRGGLVLLGGKKKDRHIGFTFPYLRDHKPSYSSSAAIPPNATTSCCYDSRVERHERDRLDGGKRAEGETGYNRAGINKFRSKLHFEQVGRCTRFMRFSAGDNSYISVSVEKRKDRRKKKLYLLYFGSRVHRCSVDDIP